MVAPIRQPDPPTPSRPAVAPLATQLTRAVVILADGRMVPARVVGQIPVGGEAAVLVEVETPAEGQA